MNEKTGYLTALIAMAICMIVLSAMSYYAGIERGAMGKEKAVSVTGDIAAEPETVLMRHDIEIGELITAIDGGRYYEGICLDITDAEIKIANVENGTVYILPLRSIDRLKREIRSSEYADAFLYMAVRKASKKAEEALEDE